MTPLADTGASVIGDARPRTLAAVEHIFADWIRDPDPLPTRAVFAAYLANQLDGDPVWMILVGGSGVGKTERLAPLTAMPNVVLESSLSGPAALLSATSRTECAKDASGGVLRKIPKSGGVLVLKDFTSVIDMHRDARAETLAALREVYDGRWDRSVGAEGGRTLTWEGKVGLLAGCTTAIDTAHAVISTMGTRFLLMRLRASDTFATAALEHVGRERAMREALRNAISSLLTHPPGQPHAVTIVSRPLAALGSFVALARSPVERDQQGEIRLVLDAEAPTRLVKMLAQLWRAAGLLGLSYAESWALVHRVALDSIPKLRLAIVTNLEKVSTPLSTTAIASAVEHPSRTTRRGLEDLHAHHVVTRFAGGDGKADEWALTEKAKNWLNESDLARFVGLGADQASTTSSIDIQTTIDDETGKGTGARRERL